MLLVLIIPFISKVGMEKSIEHLRQPLGQLKEEIVVSKKGLNDELSLIEDKLNQRKKIREKKAKLQHLINVFHSVEKIEKILFAQPGSTDIEIYMEGSRESVGHFLERVAGEFNQLQFHVNQSKGHPIIDNIKSRVSLITSKLQESLEASFLEGLTLNQSDLVLRCLRTYALIDKVGHAEDLFRHNFVKSRIGKLISEKCRSTEDLRIMCDNVIEFAKSDCSMLLNLTTEKSGSGKDEREDFVKGFDFLVNSVWPEVDDAIESKLSFIFSPGNPDLFFERYSIMMKFVESFEECCTSFESFRHLRSHHNYQTFMTKWSLPVYFQIRLQEIAGKIEAAIDGPLEMPQNGSSKLFSTNIIETVWKALNDCWNDRIFLQPLFNRFWKLFLQILSRLSVVLNDISDELPLPKDAAPESEEKSGNDSKAVSKYDLVELRKLYGDVYKLCSKVPELFKDRIEPLFQQICESSYEEHEAAFNESVDNFKSHLDRLSKYFIGYLSDEGSQQLENTKNLPRLYRRTNRDPPSQASAYVSLALNPLKTFSENDDAALENDQLLKILRATVSVITSRYFVIVDELVASIKKTEESLQRLKRLRKGADSAVSSSSPNDVTDEAKIRKQLFLDVQQFGKEASTLAALDMETHAEFKKLSALVDTVNKSNQ